MPKAIAAVLAVFALTAAAEYPDPERFRGAIDAFLAADEETPPSKGAIVATGSSSMRGWHGRIAEDLATAHRDPAWLRRQQHERCAPLPG